MSPHLVCRVVRIEEDTPRRRARHDWTPDDEKNERCGRGSTSDTTSGRAPRRTPDAGFDNQLCADMGYADAAAGVSTLIAGLLSGDIERGIATPPGLAEALDISGLGD